MNRRKFFGFAIASPFVGKAAVEKLTADAATLAASAPLSHGAMLGHVSGYISADPLTVTGEKKILWKWLRKSGFKLPEWKREELRRDALHIKAFDANVAALVSVSPSAKCAIQQRRNFTAYEKEAIAEWCGETWFDKRREWREKFGVHGV